MREEEREGSKNYYYNRNQLRAGLVCFIELS